MLMYQFFPVRF